MYTIEQIRKAGTEGEINHFDVDHIISTLELLFGDDSKQNLDAPIISVAHSLSDILDFIDKAHTELSKSELSQDNYNIVSRYLIEAKKEIRDLLSGNY